MKKRDQPKPDVFANAMAMLGGTLPKPCPACMGLGWFLGFRGRTVCPVCRGQGVR